MKNETEETSTAAIQYYRYTPQSDRQTNKILTDYLHPFDPARCRICGWPIESDYCTADHCSQRPPPATRADAAIDYAGDDSNVFRLLAQLEKRGIVLEQMNRAGNGDYTVILKTNPHTIETLFSIEGFGQKAIATGRTAAQASARAAHIALFTFVRKEETP